jgi:hypothetical protein
MEGILKSLSGYDPLFISRIKFDHAWLNGNYLKWVVRVTYMQNRSSSSDTASNFRNVVRPNNASLVQFTKELLIRAVPVFERFPDFGKTPGPKARKYLEMKSNTSERIWASLLNLCDVFLIRK